MPVFPTYSALTVAYRLVTIGSPLNPVLESDGGPDAVYLSHVRLQKFLYYCQGWGLALLGRPLFRQPLEAWALGPVVRDVYSVLRGRVGGIQLDDLHPEGEVLNGTADLLVDMVWREYIRYTPRELVEMTHREPAWREARAGLPADTPSCNVLSLETMAKFFTAEAARRGKTGPFPVVPAAEVWAADEAYERAGRKGVSADELFGSLIPGR